MRLPGLVYWMAAYGLGRAPYPGFGGYSGECVLFVRLGGTRSPFTRLRLKMREEKKNLAVVSSSSSIGCPGVFFGFKRRLLQRKSKRR